MLLTIWFHFRLFQPFSNMDTLWEIAFQLILLLFNYCSTVVFDKVNRYQKCLSVKVSKGLNWQWCWISIFIDPLLKVGPGGHLVIWRLSISSTWFQPGCGGDQSSRRLACLRLRFSETILLSSDPSSLLLIRTLLYPSLCWWSVDDQQREARLSRGQLTSY